MRARRKPGRRFALLRQQKALAALGTFALPTEDLQQVLDEAARLCAEGARVPLCKIAEHRPESADLVVRAGHGWLPGVIGTAVPADPSTADDGAGMSRRPEGMGLNLVRRLGGTLELQRAAGTRWEIVVPAG